MSVHKLPRRLLHSSKKVRARMRHTRVWLNGREVTRDCFYADPRRGVVRCFVRDEAGNIRHQHGEIERQELRGHVRVRVR